MIRLNVNMLYLLNCLGRFALVKFNFIKVIIVVEDFLKLLEQKFKLFIKTFNAIYKIF